MVILWFIVRAAPFPYELTGPGLLDRPFDYEDLSAIYFPGMKTSSVAALGGATTIAGVAAKVQSGEARIVAFEDPYTAVLALEGVFEEPGLTIKERTTGGSYTRANGTKRDGSTVELFLWTEDRWLFQLRSTTREGLDATVDQLPFLHRRAGVSFAESLLGEHAPILVGSLIAWMLLMLPAWSRAASWAAAVPPRANNAVDRAELMRRLAALGSRQGPFDVRMNGPEATLEWRAAEPPWRDALAQAEAVSLERVRFHLDEDDRTVRVIDEEAMIDWPAAAPDGSLQPPKLEYSVERAIFFFDRRRDEPLGVTVENGQPRFDPAHKYEFDSAELKEPLIALVTQSGWTYRPVFSFKSRALFG